MSNEIVMQNQQQIVDYRAKATEWLQNMGTQLPPQQATQFLELCQAYKLNPFKREIYAVGYKDKFNIITGYEVYLKRAERTGKLNGWKCEVNPNGSRAKIIIYRKDWQFPFEHEVLMNEVKQNSPIWQKMPTFMMKKVCIEQGFRLCFPDEMGGMPYGEEEVPYDRIIQSEETPEPKQIKEVYPSEQEQKSNVIAPNPEPQEDKTEAAINLEQLLNEHGIELRYKNCPKGQKQPYTLAKDALDNPNSTKAELEAMYSRCVAFLTKKGIQVA